MLQRLNERTIICDGLRFTKAPGRKYYRNTKAKLDLHRYVWIKANGPIPNGYQIHHIDHDTNNNDISNLQLLSIKEHLSMHAKLADKDKLRELAKTGREFAKEWHGSKEGKEWHKQHYDNMKDKLYVEKEYTCDCCGTKFKSTKVGSRFCSNKCKSKWRRDAGLDNVTKNCIYCGKEFTSNKYSKTTHCSKSCSKKI